MVPLSRDPTEPGDTSPSPKPDEAHLCPPAFTSPESWPFCSLSAPAWPQNTRSLFLGQCRNSTHVRSSDMSQSKLVPVPRNVAWERDCSACLRRKHALLSPPLCLPHTLSWLGWTFRVRAHRCTRTPVHARTRMQRLTSLLASDEQILFIIVLIAQRIGNGMTKS